MKGKDDSMCRKKVVKKFLIVGLLLSIILVNKNVVYAEKQQEDWENDWVNSICVMPNKTVLKGGFSGCRIGMRIMGKIFYSDFVYSKEEPNEEGYAGDVTITLNYPAIDLNQKVTAWLERDDSFKTKEEQFEVCGREYNITAKAGPLGITGNVAQYGDYKVYVQIANKEYLCTSTKIHSSIEDYGPYNLDSSEQYEPTGYDFCCSYLSQKIGTKIKVIVRDTDGYEYSKKFKIKNRAPKIQIDTVDTSVSEVSGTTSEDSNIVVTVGKKKYKCKSDESGSFCVKIKMQKPGTKVKVRVTTKEGYYNKKQVKIKAEQAEISVSGYVLRNSKKIKVKVEDARKGDCLKVFIGKKVYSYKFKKNRKSKSIKLKIKKSKAGTKIRVRLYDRFKYPKAICRSMVYYTDSIYKGMKLKHLRLSSWRKPDRRYDWGNGSMTWVYKFSDSTIRAFIRKGVVVRVQEFNY